jgi:hypothetical protein
VVTAAGVEECCGLVWFGSSELVEWSGVESGELSLEVFWFGVGRRGGGGSEVEVEVGDRRFLS